MIKVDTQLLQIMQNYIQFMDSEKTTNLPVVISEHKNNHPSSLYCNSIINSSFSFGNIFIPFVPQKEQNTFKRRAKLYLNHEFGEGNIEYDRILIPELHVKFSAINRDSDGTNLINFISGSNPSTYANSLCRSNMGFQMVEEKQSMLGIKKKVTLIDDSNESLLRAALVKPYLNYLQGRANSTDVLLRWSQHEHLREIV